MRSAEIMLLLTSFTLLSFTALAAGAAGPAHEPAPEPADDRARAIATLKSRLATEPAIDAALKRELLAVIGGSPDDDGGAPRESAGASSKTPPPDAKALAERLEASWKPRPSWGDMTIALLKRERFRPGFGWYAQGALKRYQWDWLRDRYDGNGDHCIEPDELGEPPGFVVPPFARLDRDRSGVLDADDFDATRRPEPGSPDRIASTLMNRLDTDSNGRLSADELLAFHLAADRTGTGYVTAEDIATSLDDPPGTPKTPDEMPPAPVLLTMLFSGQMGELDDGAKLGDKAPDFTLARVGGGKPVALSSLFGARPVILAFGSFT